MADSSPPTKPKPGSLRDRIAAFEKPAPAAVATSNRPPVRPKPGNVSWKPAPPSPPSVTPSATENEENKRGGMSASDAKESIGRGGTLKERMAALQGKGAFGGAMPAGPPPVGPKPMKRPPLVVPQVPVEHEEEDEESHDADEEHEDVQKTDKDVVEVDTTQAKDDEHPAEEEQDEEAKERERRAAIAARMARLGGARVGMGPPPVFGKKPVVKQKESEVREQAERSKEGLKETSIPEPGVKNLHSDPDHDDSTVGETSALAEEHVVATETKETSSVEISQTATDGQSDSVAQAAESSATPPSESRPVIDPSNYESSATTSHSPPTSMPVPPVPRRAGPPRKRSARNMKAQAAKQEEAVGEVPPLPTHSHTEPVVNPAPKMEEDIPVTEESIPSDQITTSEPVTTESSTTVNPVDERVVSMDAEATSLPLSHPVTNEESDYESPKSLQDTPHVEDDEGGLEISDPSSNSNVGDKSHSPDMEAPEHLDAGFVTPLHTEIAETPRTRERISTVAPVAEEPVYDDDSPVVYQDRTDSTNSEEALAPSTLTGQGSVSPVVPDPVVLGSSDSQVDTSAKDEPEQPQIVAAEDGTEDEEAVRRRRIAERVAKMGGRNPFSASPFDVVAPPARKASTSEPRDMENVMTHEELSVEQDTNDDDISHEQDAVTEPMVESDGHEAENIQPRVFGVAEEHEQDEDVPIVEACLEEHEETELEHKISDLRTTLSEESSASVSLPEEPLSIEDTDEMAPPRITRAIPPLPPQAHLEGRAASPTATEFKRTSVRRTLPPAPQEPVVLHDAQVAPVTYVEGESGSEEADVTSERVDLLLSASISKPSPESEHRRNAEPDSLHSSLTVSIPSLPPVVPSLAESPPSRTPSSTNSEHPRRSIPPPVPGTASPTSSRGPISPPVRKPPVPLPPRPVSPQASIVVSPTSTVRRSVSPPRIAPSEVGRAASQPLAAISVVPSTDDKGSVATRNPIKEEEILRDSDPDPVDPSLYSPQRSPVLSPPYTQQSFASRSKEVASADAAEEENEQARRQTIAERMAKLGGIKFGVPPPIHRKPAVVPSETSTTEETSRDDSQEGTGISKGANEESQERESEETIQARRQAISARLAGMGGMRFGMLPQSQAPLPVHPRTKSDDSADTVEAPSPNEPLRYPPPSESAVSDADMESEEGVKVEAGSEMSMEEVTAEEVTEEPEEIPPPVPSRPNRQSSHADIAPPLPGGRRPPIPIPSLSTRSTNPSMKTRHSSVPSPVREVSGGYSASAPYSGDFVVVNDPAEDQEVPPLPPPRATRPPRSIPPPAPPAPAVPPTSTTRDMSNSQWELPDIPSGSLDLKVGASLGLDASFASEDSTTYPSAYSPSSPPQTPQAKLPTATSAAPPSDVQLSADELLELWGMVGTAVHSIASSFFDKSKKTLIGDGTSKGFVTAVLAQVPQAAKVSYGHLIYSQNAHAVLRRSSNIMPGDIIQLTEAKLKGHKGLQSYNQTVGTAQEPLVAIVSEFEPKKSKVKVYQANQHVGSQSVETASYRLEDLKSGNIQVFRVASV